MLRNFIDNKLLGNYGTLESRNFFGIFIFLFPALLVFVLFYLIPIYTVVTTAFTRWNGFTTPEFNGIDNFTRLFGHPAFSASLKNMLYWTAIAASVHVFIGAVIGFVFYLKPLGWKLLRAVYIRLQLV